MSTVELLDHLATIFYDLVMPAIGLWVVYVLRQMLARGISSIRPPQQ